MIRFACPHCRSPFKAHPVLAGRHGRCPQCDCTIDVPAEAQTNPADEVSVNPFADLPVVELPALTAAKNQTIGTVVNSVFVVLGYALLVILLIPITLLAAMGSSPSSSRRSRRGNNWGPIFVAGHFRKDGRYVSPHTRSRRFH